MTMYRLIPGEQRLQRFQSTAFDKRYLERDLEDWLERNPTVVTDGEPLLVIGRQLTTELGGTLDLLALDADGAAVIIELKRAPTPRDVVAQVLEYAAWVNTLGAEDIERIAEGYLRGQAPPRSLAGAWGQAFGRAGEMEEAAEAAVGLPADVTLNDRQRLVVVLEGSNQRAAQVIRYLRSQGLDIVLQEYHYYQTEAGEEILDIEMRVGAESVESAPRSRYTEQEALTRFPADGLEGYYRFRDHLLKSGELVMAPQRSAVSFYKPTRDGRVFICYYAHRQNGSHLALRFDSLMGHLAPDAILAQLRPAVPEGAEINHGSTWCVVHFAPKHALRMAQIVEEIIVSKVG